MQPIPRERAEQRLTQYVNEGREKSARVVKELADEAASRLDVFVPRRLMSFQVTPDNVALQVSDPRLPEALGFTQWARSQMLGTLGVQERFLNGLQADGATGADIATDLLNRLSYRIGGEGETNGKAKRLLRIVKGDVKGWLSPTYGMFDQGALLTGFAAAIQQAAGRGIVFTDGVISDRRYGITAIHPQIIEPWAGEYVIAGVQLQSSDYGFGAVDLVQQLIRVVCVNGAIGVSFFRKIHKASGLGGGDEHVFEVSERTRQLGAQATVSLLTDAVSGAFNSDAIGRAVTKYRAAAVKEINPQNEANELRKDGLLTKEDAEKMPALLEMDLEILPATENKHSALRFGQLLSYMAGESEGEKQINLMQAAGKYTII